MQVPILSGIYSDPASDFRTSYPYNMRPVPKVQGISEGYLRTAEGIVHKGSGAAGLVRGGIEWNGECYRVIGTDLVKVGADGTVNVLGTVTDGGPVSMTYGFSRLAIVAGGDLFYWDGTTLTQVTDPDLGTALDVIWIDGYFMTTDGEYLVVTDLADPTAIDPLKYGSAEVDADPIVAVKKLRNEAYAVGRYSIEAFYNAGGSGFPFSRINGAQIHKGAVGTHMAQVFMSSIAFVGGGHNEPPAVWIGQNGGTAKISTREIDERLMTYTEAQLENSVCEVVTEKSHETLMIHLPDVTMCYDAGGSQVLQQPVWYYLTSSASLSGAYRARYYVWANDRWMIGDPASAAVGEINASVATHWGEHVSWSFGTPVIYNEGRAFAVHEIELVGLPGSAAMGVNPRVATRHADDGGPWSSYQWIEIGKTGEYSNRMRWARQGMARNWRVQEFRGDSDAPLAVARLDATIEAMAW